MVPIIAQFPISSSLLCSMDERRAGLEKSFEKMRERTYFCSVYVIFLKEIPSTFLSSRSWLLESQVFAWTRRSAKFSTCFDQKVTRHYELAVAPVVILEKKLSSSRRCWITRDSNARARGSRGENRAVRVWKRGAMIQISARGGEKCRESSSLKGRITYGGRWFLSSSPPFTARLEAVVAWRGDCPVPLNDTRVKTSVGTSTSRGRGENTRVSL